LTNLCKQTIKSRRSIAFKIEQNDLVPPHDILRLVRKRFPEIQGFKLAVAGNLFRLAELANTSTLAHLLD
jgi:hypothetical protein